MEKFLKFSYWLVLLFSGAVVPLATTNLLPVKGCQAQ
jgi:hypothetical protein